MIQTLFIVLSAVLSVVVLALAWHVHRVKQAFMEYRLSAEQQLERSSQMDESTRALKADVFMELLSIECRRSVRDFTPLSLMIFEVQSIGDATVSADVMAKVASVLRHHLSRPGDQLGRCSEATLGLLLPSTNEHAGAFAQRCHEAVMDHFKASPYQFTLAACTFQPSADLNSAFASEQVQQVLSKALQEKPGQVLFHAEHNHDFNPLYT